MKKLNDKDRKIFKIFLQSLNFENYKAMRGESKSGRYKISKTIPKKNIIWKAKDFRKYHTM